MTGDRDGQVCRCDLQPAVRHAERDVVVGVRSAEAFCAQTHRVGLVRIASAVHVRAFCDSCILCRTGDLSRRQRCAFRNADLITGYRLFASAVGLGVSMTGNRNYQICFADNQLSGCLINDIVRNNISFAIHNHRVSGESTVICANCCTACRRVIELVDSVIAPKLINSYVVGEARTISHLDATIISSVCLAGHRDRQRQRVVNGDYITIHINSNRLRGVNTVSG